MHLRRAVVPLPHGQGLLNGQLPLPLCRWTTDERPHLQHKRQTLDQTATGATMQEGPFQEDQECNKQGTT